VVLDGLSKRLALPQVKLGWMLLGGPSAFRDELRTRLEFALDAQLSLAAPVQHALPDLLGREEAARAVLTDRLRASELAVREECAGSSISVLPREAGWSLVLRVPTSDDTRLAVRLLERHGVYATPGSFFGFARQGYLVVSLLVAPLEARRAARALIAVLDDDDDGGDGGA
jgi:aspartate/methionine/tyrosine aminotransferase